MYKVAKNEHLEQLRKMLMRQPSRTATILAEMGISQPTFSRLWPHVHDGTALGAGRARQYGLRRHISGVDAPVPVFRVSPKGQVDPIGYIDPLYDGFYALTPLEGTDFSLFQGMPFFLRDLRPSRRE